MRLANGTAVGEYEITGILGEGAFGTVYSAVHPVIGKSAAIKVLKERAAESAELVQRFKHEARAVNAIEHPNIVDIFGYGALPDGRPYLIMEYLRGQSLQQLIAQQGGRLTVEMLFPILRDVAAAVDAAHRCRVVHRDLKPENIFVAEYTDAPSRVKVLDFGIAKMATSSMIATQEGKQMGTPLFMAPEQCFGKPTDHRIDIYAFGVIAFHGLSGHYPVYADTVVAIVGRHMMGERSSLSQLSLEHARFDAAMARCLALEPGHRFGSLSEAYHALASAHGQPLPTGPYAVPVMQSGPAGAFDSGGLATLGMSGPSGSSGPGAVTSLGPYGSSGSSGYSHGSAPGSFHGSASGGPPSHPHASAPGAPAVGGSTLGRAAGAMVGRSSHHGADHRARAGVIGAVGLLVAALAAVAIVVAVQAMGKETEPKSPEHAAALAQVKRHMVAEKWDQAMVDARALLDADPDDNLAHELLAEAREEGKNAQLYQLFTEAVAEQPPDTMSVATIYDTIPETSLYRTRATPPYTRVRASWLAPKATRAARLASAKECEQLDILAQEVDFMFPESSPRFRGLSRTCRGLPPEDSGPGGPEDVSGSEDKAVAAVAMPEQAASPEPVPAVSAALPPSSAADSAGDSKDDLASDDAHGSESATPAKNVRKRKKASRRSRPKADPPGRPDDVASNRGAPGLDDLGSEGVNAAPAPQAPVRPVERVESAKRRPVRPQAPAKPVSGSSHPERLSRANIVKTMGALRSRVAGCGEQNHSKGVVKLKVKVAPGGEPSEVAVVAAPDSMLGSCVGTVVEGARFPRTQKGGVFTYPFVF